jgi:two-component system sensor histidine kinase VicK
VPLRTHEAVIGVLHVGLDHQRSFSSTEIQLLTAIAEVAGSALQRANLLETLEQRVEARTRELARANERLQELDRLKDQFISNVSHELRTPLTNIKLHLGLLEKRGAEVLPRYLPTLQRETERLRRLIDDLLDLSRLQAQVAPLRRERLAVDALLREVVALHIARAEARSLAIRQESAPAPLEINVDRHQMFQVFTNLLSNAVAYTPAGGQVRVSAGPAERGGRPGLEVIVHNTGVIPGEDLPHLFKRFFRGRTGVESGEAGTGLGLSISKEIVEQHEGRIAITSTPREGTTVTVWLPQIE